MYKKQLYEPSFWLQILLTGLLFGLLISRAVVSICSVALIVMYVWRSKKTVVSRPFIWGILMIILPVVISGFWSSNRDAWLRAVEVKIPLLTIGLGLLNFHISKQVFTRIVLCVLLVAFAGSVWSILQYVANASDINKAYLQAKVMPSPLNNDHIRFSWFVVLALLLTIPQVKTITDKWLFKACIAVMIWLVVYLHLLAAKTGLLCLYVAAIIFIIHYIFTGKKWKYGVLMGAMFLLLPVTAYVTFPSLRNRVQYVVYDFNNYSKGNFVPGSSDGARVLSLKAGWHIFTSHPLTGVGFGDMRPAVEAWHQKFNPQSFTFDQFLPLNEWLLYGSGAGLPGIIGLTIGLLLMLCPLWKKGIYGRITVVVLLIPLMTDDTIESQFGVVIFIFVIMWFRYYFSLLETSLDESAIRGIDL